MKFRKEKKQEVGVNLTPLIDVVFLLLIFFMVSTSFTQETFLQIDLPEASAEPASDTTQGMTLAVSQSGSYAINGQVLSAPTRDLLEEGLKLQAKGDFSQRLVIIADAQATHQSVVTAMDVAGQLGFKNLRISTQEPVSDASAGQ